MSAPRRRRPLRTLALLAGGGLAAVLTLAGGGLVWLNTPAGNRWLHRLILDQAAPYLPEATLEIDGFSTRLPGFIDLTGVRVIRWDGVVMARIDHMRLDYSLARLLGGEVNVDRLWLEAPDIRLEVLEDGRLDWLRALGIPPTTEPAEPPQPWEGLSTRVGLSLAKLDGGRLTYLAGGDSAPFVVEGIALDGRAAVGGGRRAEVFHLSAQATPGDYDTLFLEGGLQYRDSVVTTEDLLLMMGGSLLTVRGVVADAEVRPLLNLEIGALPLARDTLTPLAGQEVLRQDVNVAATVRGTLEQLGLGLSASAQAGTLTAQGTVRPSDDPLAWMLEVRPQGLSLEDLLVGLSEPVQLAGRYRVEGSGTAWPAGIIADLEASAPDQVIWGQDIQVLELSAHLEGGKLDFTRAFARHPVGEATITGGSVDLVEETASVQADVQVPSLGALGGFGLVGYQGSVSARGPVRVAWGGEAPSVQATLQIQGSALGSKDFSLAGVSTEALVVSVEGDTVQWSGDAHLEQLGAAGLQIASLDLAALTGDYRLSSGAAQVGTQVAMGSLVVGDGSFVLDGLSGGLRAGVDGRGQPFLATEELVLSAMLLAPIGFTLDGGPVSLSLEDEQVVADLTLKRGDRVAVELAARGALDTGRWVVEELFVFPSAEQGIANPEAMPIEFTLAGDEGVEDLSLVLVLSGQDPREVNPRQLALEKASYITLQGGTAGESPDLKLGAHRIELAWVSSMVNLFLSEDPETPVLPPLTGTVDLLASAAGFAPDAAISADLKLRELRYPDVADAINLHLGVRDTLGAPALSLEVRGAEEKLMLAAQGVLPLDLEAGSLDCSGELRARALLAPVALPRLQERLPVLAGLPEGDASADVHITGSPCDPELRMVAAYAGPVGAHGEKGRLDVVVERRAEDEARTLSVEAYAEEGGVRRLEVSGAAADRLGPVLTWAIQGGPEPDLEDPETYIGAFQVNVVPLELPLELLARLGGLPASMTGRMVGGVSLSGTVQEPQVTGGLVLLDTRIGQTDVQAAQLSLLPVSEEGRAGYELSAMFDFEQKGGLELSGFMPLTLARLRDEEEEALYAVEGWTLEAKGPGLPLELLNGLVDGVEDAEGLLALEGGFKGSLNTMSSELRLRIRNGALVYTPLDIRYEDIQLDVRQVGDQLTVYDSSLRSRPLYGLGVSPPGTLTLKGNVALKGMMPSSADLRVGMDDFTLIATQEMRLATSGDLQMSGVWPALSVEGSVRLTQGILNLEDSFFTGNADLGVDDRLLIVRGDEVDEEAMLAALSARRQTRSADETSELMEKLRARVTVDLNNNLHLDMSYPLESSYGEQLAQLTSFGLGADMTGELTATYSSNDLGLVGTVELTRGEAQILNRSFNVETDSEVRFVGGDYTNPFLNIKARYVTQQYGDVVLSIGNTALDPRFDYSSENAEQEYDQSDLFAILLLGRPASALADSEGESNMSALSLALSTVTGSVSSALGGTVVDEVDWDPESGVRIGKSISEKLFLVYDRNNNPDDTENINQVSLEWLISRRLYAEFMTGDRAQSSANIYWRRIFGEAGTELHNPHLMPGNEDSSGGDDGAPDAE